VSTAQHTHLHKLNSFTTDLPCCSSSSSHSATRCARTRRASTPCTLRCCPPIWHTLPPSAVAVRPLTPAHAHSAEIAAAQAFFFLYYHALYPGPLRPHVCALPASGSLATLPRLLPGTRTVQPRLFSTLDSAFRRCTECWTSISSAPHYSLCCADADLAPVRRNRSWSRS
jgi:hypothetical protein